MALSNLDMEELEAFLGLLVLSAALKDNHLTTTLMFDTSYCGERYKATTTEHLTKKRRDARKADNKLAPISNIWDMLLKNCRENYKPGINAMLSDISGSEGEEGTHVGLQNAKKRKKTGKMSDVMKKLRATTHEVGDDCQCSRYKMNELDVNLEIQKRKRKKGVLNKSEYKAEIIKKARVSGSSYISWTGKEVPEITPGEDCKCRRKCFTKVADEERKRIFETFRSLGSKNEQDNYLQSLIAATEVKQKRRRK
ncbi:hypothetical protein J6590_067327 [Homalodisca vitripennis]|nr:hypothetical protein J6590_067327 [Homalodisca vitripennis]